MELWDDACDPWSATKAIIKAAGLDPDSWGICLDCKGDGVDSELKEAYEAWKEKEPPAGEGYQLWETCTEGSPVSPIFTTAEELADWCADNATIFASEKTPKENWLRMFLGQKDLETESLLIIGPGYFGAATNMPEEKEEEKDNGQ